MCASNSVFFLILCGMLFVLLGVLAWLDSRDPAGRGRHADLRDECMTATPPALGSRQTDQIRSSVGAHFWVSQSPNTSVAVCSRCQLPASQLDRHIVTGAPACGDCHSHASQGVDHGR